MSTTLISSGEAKDLAILGYLLGILEMEHDYEFISPEDNKKLNKIEKDIKTFIGEYKGIKSKIMAKLKKITNIVVTNKANYCIQLTTLGINLVYLNFAWNERKKPLSYKLSNFWSTIEEDLTYLMHKDWDVHSEQNCEQEHVDSIALAYDILGGL